MDRQTQEENGTIEMTREQAYREGFKDKERDFDGHLVQTADEAWNESDAKDSLPAWSPSIPTQNGWYRIQLGTRAGIVWFSAGEDLVYGIGADGLGVFRCKVIDVAAWMPREESEPWDQVSVGA